MEVKVLDKFVGMIEDMKVGLDPEVLAKWYETIEGEAKANCPEKFRDSIIIQQDPILWMKFEVKASRHAAPYLVQAIEKHLPKMSLSTRLYFQKVEEIIDEEVSKFYR